MDRIALSPASLPPPAMLMEFVVQMGTASVIRINTEATALFSVRPQHLALGKEAVPPLVNVCATATSMASRASCSVKHPAPALETDLARVMERVPALRTTTVLPARPSATLRTPAVAMASAIPLAPVCAILASVAVTAALLAAPTIALELERVRMACVPAIPCTRVMIALARC